jgi:hypothetical protein
MGFWINTWVTEGEALSEVLVIADAPGEFVGEGSAFLIRAYSPPEPPGLNVGGTYGVRFEGSAEGAARPCTCTGFFESTFFFSLLDVPTPSAIPEPWKPPQAPHEINEPKMEWIDPLTKKRWEEDFAAQDLAAAQSGGGGGLVEIVSRWFSSLFGGGNGEPPPKVLAAEEDPDIPQKDPLDD